ncbi:alpha/beta fold hydrolase [Elizabethkingia sp. JS20170427COW]|uniref:alpha/beta fold hydrolase n=1 Tax=Elizabethkingia sp. JS20170427COW TaxID=2583851 RepID=UPI0011102ED3|nr:alpha/beta hydrolase [Elizabethkingia sp. JS20170427COW]QCX52663.1 alpha/beta hydrolase [Elizabethkingia sp. JS20170427COW]
MHQPQIALRIIEKENYQPTIVLLHGALGSMEQWKDFPEKLSDTTGCSVLLYDRMGYGASEGIKGYRWPQHYMEEEADFLVELLDGLELDQVILYGHSDGGTIALLAAAKYPKRFKGIVVEAAHIFNEDHIVHGIQTVVQQYVKTSFREELIKYHGEKTDELFQNWAGVWLSPDFKTWNIEPVLKSINIPLLAIQGELDGFGTMKQMMGIVNQVGGFPKALLAKNCGHAPHLEDTPMVLSKIREWMKTIGE